MNSQHFCLPQTHDFTAAAAWLWQQEDITASTLFVPTANAAKCLTAAFIATSTAPTQPLPRILPLNSAAAGFTVKPAAPLVQPLQKRLFFFEQINARAKVQKLNLPTKQAWQLALTLEQVVDEFTLHKLDAQRVADILAAHHLARHWEDNLALLNIALTTYPAFLAEQNLTDPIVHERQIYTTWAEHLAQTEVPLWALGFPDTTPLGLMILRTIATHSSSGIISPALTGDGVADTPLANLWHDLNLPAPTPLPTTANTQTSAITALNAPDANIATLSTALMMKEQFEQDKTAMLVTPDAQFGRAVQQHLSRWGLVADDSAGMALSATPAGQFLQCLLDAAAELTPKTLAALLQHPLCTLEHTHTLDVILLRDQPPTHCTLKGYAYKLEQAAYDFPPFRSEDIAAANTCWHLLSAALAPLLDAPVHQQGLPAYLTNLQAAFSTLTNTTLAPEIITALTDWADAMATSRIPLNRAVVRDLAVAHLGSIITRPRGLDSLKIRGPLQARFDDADAIILAPLDAGVWPPETKLHPWLNQNLRQELGLPSTQKTAQLAANHYWTLLQNPQAAITLVRSAHHKNGQAQAASTLWDDTLKQLSTENQTAAFARGQVYLDYATAYIQKGQTTDFYTPEQDLINPPQQTPETWSASFVDALMNCAYRGRLQRFARLEALPDYDAAPDGLNKGNIVHDCLFAFFKPLPHPPRDCPPPFQDTLNFNTLAVALSHLLHILDAHLTPLPQHTAEVWRLRLNPQFKAWLIENIIRQQTGQSIALLEQPGTYPLTATVQLKAKVDRIDTGATGATIIDYKTGSIPSKSDVKTGAKPQLMVEAWLLAQAAFGENLPAPTNLEHWQIGTNASDFTIESVAINNEDLTSAATGLTALADAHHSNHTYTATPAGQSFTPAGHCQFCVYAGICRYKNTRPDGQKIGAAA